MLVLLPWGLSSCLWTGFSIWPPLAKKVLYNPNTGEASIDLLKCWAPVKQRSFTGGRRPAGTYLCLHQIDPLGAQLSHAVKYINHTFVLCHVKHDVNGNEAPCSPSPSTGKKREGNEGPHDQGTERRQGFVEEKIDIQKITTQKIAIQKIAAWTQLLLLKAAPHGVIFVLS